jgi:hypothetical protein
MSWALHEFYEAVEEEFGVKLGDADAAYLETPGSVIDYVVENADSTNGMDPADFRDHIAGVVGEIMARTLGVTRYREDSRFVQDLHVR